MIDSASIIVSQAEYWLDFLDDPAIYPLPEDDLQGAARALDNLTQVPQAWDMTVTLAKVVHPLMEYRGYWSEWDNFLRGLLLQARERDDDVSRIAFLIRRGIIQSRRGDMASSVRAYLRAWRIARQRGDVLSQAVTLTNLADLYRQLSLFWRARVICEHAVDLFERVDDRLRRAHALNTLGIVYMDQHGWPQATLYLERAIEAFEELGDVAGLAKVHHNLGTLYSYKKQHHKALEYLFLALDYYIDADNPFEIAQARTNIGYTYLHLRDFARAEMVLSQAETAFRELHHLYSLAQARHNLGIVYRGIEDWREARRCFQWAIAQWQDLEDHWNLAHTCGEFAEMYLAWGRWHEARVYLQKAERLIAEKEMTGAYATLRQELTRRWQDLPAHPPSKGARMSQDLIEAVEEVITGPLSRDDKLQAICALLEHEVPYYDWVGFYLVDTDRERELVLGPYVGAPTDHTRIAFGEGICGQAADTEATFIIQDVSQETNYLSCSPDVQSEIVIPIMKDGRVVGELDIDSHALAPFTAEDRAVLEEIARRVAELF